MAVSPDSLIGCLISLTSKSEIRYEGIIYNINTEESTIGLQNVRSFGTEGRKKDGPQVPASDKIYEYILFRGSDIKDLQVKSSPPEPAAPTHNDPAIIQSHYSHPVSASTSSPPIGTGIIADIGSSTAQFGLPGTAFQGGLPLHQPGGSLGSWGSSPSPPNPNGSGLAMPLYWPQGYYTPSSGGLPSLQQPSFLHPPPGLPISMQQSLQYPAMNAALPSVSLNLTEVICTTSPLALSHIQPSSLALDISSLQYKPPVTSFPTAALGSNLPFVSPLISNLEFASVSRYMPSTSNITAVPDVASQTFSQSVPSNFGSSNPSEAEISAPLVTPGDLLQPGLSTISSSQPLTTIGNAEAKPPEVKLKAPLSEPPVLAPTVDKDPILPLPVPSNQKPSQAGLQNHQGIRGRGRGRRTTMYIRRPSTKFEEDFDFTAMNEKFNKVEVWGHLGKSKAQSGDGEGEDEDETGDALEADGGEPLNFRNKPVYVKDDFFDSLSNNALDSRSRSGRIKFSERMKMDTETFGDFQRHLGGPGGGRSSYYGRGYSYGSRGVVRGRTGNHRDY